VVVIPLAMQHCQLLERNLLSTAVTRERKLVVIIAEPKALRMAVERQESQRRITQLAERSREGVRGLTPSRWSVRSAARSRTLILTMVVSRRRNWPRPAGAGTLRLGGNPSVSRRESPSTLPPKCRH
jgi:hypothetical protein